MVTRIVKNMGSPVFLPSYKSQHLILTVVIIVNSYSIRLYLFCCTLCREMRIRSYWLPAVTKGLERLVILSISKCGFLADTSQNSSKFRIKLRVNTEIAKVYSMVSVDIIVGFIYFSVPNLKLRFRIWKVGYEIRVFNWFEVHLCAKLLVDSINDMWL